MTSKPSKTTTRTPVVRKPAPDPVALRFKALPETVLGVSREVTSKQASDLNTKAKDASIHFGIAVAMLVAKGQTTFQDFAKTEGVSTSTMSYWGAAGALCIRIGSSATIQDGRNALYVVNALRSAKAVSKLVGDRKGRALAKALRDGAKTIKTAPPAESQTGARKARQAEADKASKASKANEVQVLTNDATRLKAMESVGSGLDFKAAKSPAIAETIRTLAGILVKAAEVYGVDYADAIAAPTENVVPVVKPKARRTTRKAKAA